MNTYQYVAVTWLGGAYGSGISWSPDGHKLLNASGKAGILDRATLLNPTLGGIVVSDFEPYAVAWSPDGKRLAVGDRYGDPTKGNVFIYDAQTYKLINQFKPFSQNGPADIEWGPDGKHLALAGHNSKSFVIQVWDWQTEQMLVEYKPELVPYYFTFFGFSWSKYGGRLFFGENITTDVKSMAQPDLRTPGSGVRIEVPIATLAGLNSVAKLCLVDTQTRSSSITFLESDKMLVLEANDLPDFITRVKALPKGAIPPACAADLIAVAEAIIAQP
jgi:WD40 repeat protein